MKKIFLGVICLLALALQAQEFDTLAPKAFLIDAQTGAILLNKEGDEPMPTASMSKLMTAYMVFDALKRGDLKPDTEFTVSENAWRKGGAKSGGSTMFLAPHQQVKVADLLRGVIIQSGNDACIVIAENMAGTEEAFANLMNVKAKELGLTQTTLKNATGLPEEGHMMSPRDLALLAQHIVNDFPEYYPIYSETSFTFNHIKQGNRNPLLGAVPGADGLKTGHTEASGYGLVGSATQDGRRLIMVVNGLKSMKQRTEESRRLMAWGLSSFENATVAQGKASLVEIPVWLGKQKTVAAGVEKPIILTLRRGEKQFLKAKIAYDTPVKAPVMAGQKIGELTLTSPNGNVSTYPLVALQEVKRVGIFGKIKAVIGSWF